MHCTAKSFEKTDWQTIVYLYEQLELIAPSYLITLNKIVAKSYLHNPVKGLEELNQLKNKTDLQEFYMLHVTEGDLRKRAGNGLLAKESFVKAFELATSPFEKRFLEKKIEECETTNNA